MYVAGLLMLCYDLNVKKQGVKSVILTLLVRAKSFQGSILKHCSILGQCFRTKASLSLTPPFGLLIAPRLLNTQDLAPTSFLSGCLCVKHILCFQNIGCLISALLSHWALNAVSLGQDAHLKSFCSVLRTVADLAHQPWPAFSTTFWCWAKKMTQCLLEQAQNSDGGLFRQLGASLSGECDRCFRILVALVYPVF